MMSRGFIRGGDSEQQRLIEWSTDDIHADG